MEQVQNLAVDINAIIKTENIEVIKWNIYITKFLYIKIWVMGLEILR